MTGGPGSTSAAWRSGRASCARPAQAALLDDVLAVMEAAPPVRFRHPLGQAP